MRARLATHAIAALSRHARSRLSDGATRRALANALAVGPLALSPDAAARPLVLAGGTIDGKVTASTSKAPLAGIEVCAFEPEASAELEEPFFKCTTTDAGGEYSLAGLPPGSYVVEFFTPPESGLDYQTQFYNGQARERNANPVLVKSGEVTPEIDAALLPGGEITGAVSSAVTKGALADVLVCALDEAEESGNCAFTGPSGAYTISGLATGSSYMVAFIPFEEKGSSVSYAIQFYDGAPTEALASDVSVLAGGAPTSNIDASLVEGVPRERSNPAIAGNAVAGQTLTVVQASWTNSPTSVFDVWGRCNGAGTSCFVAGTGASHTLTPSDVGHTFVVKEAAFDPAGESEPAFSPLSAIVAPAPPVPPLPAAPTVAPAIGVLSSTSATVSAAQLRSLLARLLAPSGRNAKIGQLLRHRGYSISFQAPSAGKLTISWYLVPRGARLSGAKPVLAASGSVSPAGAGATKLTIKLTARGRGMLSHASRLSLTAKGLLSSSGGTAVSAAKAFTVRR